MSAVEPVIENSRPTSIRGVNALACDLFLGAAAAIVIVRVMKDDTELFKQFSGNSSFLAQDRMDNPISPAPAPLGPDDDGPELPGFYRPCDEGGGAAIAAALSADQFVPAIEGRWVIVPRGIVALLGLWRLPSLLARTASRHAFIRVGAIAGLALAALRVMFEPLLAVWFRMIPDA